MQSWTVIDSEGDAEVGTITYDGVTAEYLGNDFALGEIVDTLNIIDADELPDLLANASSGRYLAISDEGPEEELGDLDQLSEGQAGGDDEEDEPVPLADSGWVATVLRESTPAGTISGTSTGRLEFEIQDATLQMLLLTDVVPALESASMTPVREGYADALKRTIEALKVQDVQPYRVELAQVASMREATGGALADAPIRWGSVSPQWGGPAAPWAPVPLKPAKDFIRDHPDADIEINFPTVFEEDRSAKVKDLLAGNTSGFISHRRTSEQYAKEMGFEQYDYDDEQAEIAREKPRSAQVTPPQDVLAQKAAGMGSPGSPGGAKPPIVQAEMAGNEKQPVQAALADAPGRGVARAEWATDNAPGRHAFRRDQKRLAEDDEIDDAVEAWRGGERR